MHFNKIVLALITTRNVYKNRTLKSMDRLVFGLLALTVFARADKFQFFSLCRPHLHDFYPVVEVLSR